MSDSNTFSLAYSAETFWGVTPVVAPMKLVRLTKENLEHEKVTEISSEIRSDRQRLESTEVGVGAKGGFDFELSVGGQDDFIEAAMFSAFADVGGVPTITNGTTRKSFFLEKQTISGAAYQPFAGMMVDSLTLNLQSRKIITGTVNFMGRRGYDSASSYAVRRTQTLTFTGQPADTETVTVGAKTYTFQAALTNVANNVKIGASTAASIANLVAAINADTTFSGTGYAAATTANVDFGAVAGAGTTVVVTEFTPGGAGTVTTTDTITNATWGGGTAVAAAGYTAASTGLILTSSVNVGNLLKDGAAIGGLKNLTVTIANNLRGNDEIGRKDFGEIGVGECAVSGKFDAYFRTRALFTDFMDHTARSLSFEVSREAPGAVSGDVIGYRVTIPKLRFGKGMPMAPGKNTDIMLPMEFDAEIDTVSGKTIKIEKLKKA